MTRPKGTRPNACGHVPDPDRLYHRDPAKPPPHGPYATCGWDAARGGWVLRLTEEGQAVVVEYLDRWPNPQYVVKRYYPRTWEAVSAAVGPGPEGEDLMRAAAMAGVCRGVVAYDPARGALTTIVVPHVRTALQHLMIRRAGEPRPDEFWRPDALSSYVAAARPTAGRNKGGGHTDSNGWDALPGVPVRPPARPPAWTADEWAAALAPLPDREREVLALRFRDGLRLHQIAGRLGLSKERVRQIQNDALRRLAADPPAFLLQFAGEGAE